MLRKLLVLALVVMFALIGYIYFVYFPQLPVANGYAAKKMCSCTFIADRDQESIQRDDLGFSPINMTKTIIDKEAGSATSSFFGFAPRTAVYREDAGCILLEGKDDYQISLKVERPTQPDSLYWPYGPRTDYPDTVQRVNLERLGTAVDRAFDRSRKMDTLKTRAVVVVYKGKLIAESYAEGFDKDTEILGWSMTKSITSTMIGILVKNNKLALSDQALFPEWKDKRAEITLRDMLQMQSGLAFDEDYGTLSDATRMLFTSEDVSNIPISKSLAYDPGSFWSYSSGTTNALSRLIAEQFETKEAYLRFPYDSIFNRIGMNSTVIETDESGRYIGSSYCYATPRDWAKFGLLYLNQGNWNGDQIIDSSWVDFVQEPAAQSQGVYGGHFWLNKGQSNFSDAPGDLYFCNGFQGQSVFIIPSKDLVIVRMGLSEYPDFNNNTFLKEILDAFY